MKNMMIASLLLAAGSAAQAQNGTTVVGTISRVEVVPYKSSDLASRAAVRGLQTRVRHAARRVCQPSSPANLAPNDNTYEFICVSRALKDGFAQVDRAVASRWTAHDIAMTSNIVVAAR